MIAIAYCVNTGVYQAETSVGGPIIRRHGIATYCWIDQFLKYHEATGTPPLFDLITPPAGIHIDIRDVGVYTIRSERV